MTVHPAAHADTNLGNGEPMSHSASSTPRPYASWPLNGRNSTSLARDLVAAIMADCGADPDVTDTAVRCSSELAANAAEHARGPVWLSVWIGPDAISVHVTDTSPERPVRLPAYDPEPVREITLEELDALDPEQVNLERGRGLGLVVQECHGRCGVAYDRLTKNVWFSVRPPWMRPLPPSSNTVSLPARPLAPSRPFLAPRHQPGWAPYAPTHHHPQTLTPS